jgi:hypothetical protein
MAMGGVGEAMLLGAAMGGGSAALTGGDPLKGALLGGLTGGAGAGITGALGGTAAGTAGTLTGSGLAAGATPAMTTAGSTLGSSIGNTLAGMEPTLGASTNFALNAPATTGLNVSNSLSSLNPSVAQSAMQGGTNFALNAPTTLPGASSGYALGAPSIAPGSSAGITSLPAAAPSVTASAAPQTFSEGMAKFANDPMASLEANKFTAAASGMAGAIGAREEMEGPEDYNGPLKRFKFNPDSYRSSFFAAEGGIATLASGGYDRMVGEEPMYMSNMARGGISDLGSYSDGGRMLRGPGDGMSDSIPASIAGKRPARLATEEFVVPADVVSHLGNGSSDAGARQLYAMMDRVRKARTGRKSQGREISPQRYMAA